MFSLDSHKQLLDNFFEHKANSSLHHASIFIVKDALLLDSFINKLCSIITATNIDDFKSSEYVSVVNTENNEIKVAEIKKIIKSCELSAHNDIAKIIIIENLELLNESAANALLKTLEEPSGNTFLLMFTRDYSRVLDTVKSRALHYSISFTQEDYENYLRYTFDMTNDAISKSMKLARNDVNIIAKIKLEPSFWQVRNQLMKVLVGQAGLSSFLKETSSNHKDVLYWLTSILIDAFYLSQDMTEDNLANYDKVAVIKHILLKLGDAKVFELYKEALDAKTYFLRYKNVDKELILENLILQII